VPASYDADTDFRFQSPDGLEHDIRWLLGALWNCTDVLPAGYCQQLDIEQGSTYAQAVRALRAQTD
jgi:hypothetical protein